MSQELIALCQAEGFKVYKKANKIFVEACGKEIPLNHPFSIYGKLYREETNPELKYNFFKRMSELAWPDEIFHEWTSIRYKTHCGDKRYISYAGGASCGKSRDAAKIGLLFWLSDPKNNACIIASTTLNSLTARIGGYALNLLRELKVNIPYIYMRSQPPKILYRRDDMQNGIFFVAAKQGSDEAGIRELIGRHPGKRILIIADESTDLPLSLIGALPNLETGVEFFQCMMIGNSCSVFDLHGVLSTPKDGWDSIDPMIHTSWETNRKDGIVLYFSPFNSPAIHETDPKRKKALGKFLITEEQLKEKEKTYGADSDAYWRFVLGFWRVRSTENTVVSKEFLSQKDIYGKPEWLGIEPLAIVAGLDVAFSTNGDQCILRLGTLGQDVRGRILLDFKGEKFLFKIPISATSRDPAEIQIAKQVIEILGRFGVPLHNLCIDSTGSGRAMAGTLMLQAGVERPPLKVLTVRQGEKAVASFDAIIKTPYDLWMNLRSYIEHQQIKGVDGVTAAQLSSRLVVRNPKTGKVQLESKLDYKRRMAAIMPSLAHSPDEADAACLCLQSAIANYGFSEGQIREIKIKDGSADKYFLWKQGQRALQTEHVESQEPKIPVPGFSTSVEDWIGTRKGF